MKITAAKSSELLRQDLAWVEHAISYSVRVDLSQNQYDALCSLIFNIGDTAFSTSTLLRMLNAGNYDGAADQFLRWNRGGGKVLPGLVKRRAAERELFLS